MSVDPTVAMEATINSSPSQELFEESGGDDMMLSSQEPRPAFPQSTQRRALDVADDMVLEYIAFRGFTETFRSFSLARGDDRANRGSFDAKFALEALLRPIAELDGMSMVPLLFAGPAGNSTPWRSHSFQQFHENCNTWISLRIANESHTSSFR